jgi:hypothetical protein
MLFRVLIGVDFSWFDKNCESDIMIQREEQMRGSFLLGVCILAVAACAPQETPPPAAPPPAAPAAAAPTTTTYYDGTYTGSFVEGTGGPPGATCPNIKVAPALTIHDGVARFAALDLTFEGDVTPQGELRMLSQGGETFEGLIDPYFVLKGRVTGNCIYDATWHRLPKY